MGMHANQYYYAGGLDEWFFETDSDLTIDDLIHYFRQAMLANGGDTSGNVDALTEPGAVTLRKGIDNLYPESGQLTTIAAEQIGAVGDAELGRVVGVERVSIVQRRGHGLSRVLARGVVTHLHSWQEVASLCDHVLVSGAQGGSRCLKGWALAQGLLHHAIELGAAKGLPPLAADLCSSTDWQRCCHGATGQRLRRLYLWAYIVRADRAASEQNGETGCQTQS